MPKPTYPADHKPGMRVPKGGSMCANCRYLVRDGIELTGRHCKQPDFIKWNGGSEIPDPINEFCSDWYEPRTGTLKQASERAS
jgi:hypothetical protein